ncbi:hypothetical protein [Brevibacillus brevis]|uniref:hypothetical protein n=1 Tax=Brevibacillus brevis TaxID=1393 RepID=UPI0037CB3344
MRIIKFYPEIARVSEEVKIGGEDLSGTKIVYFNNASTRKIRVVGVTEQATSEAIITIRD